MREVFGIIALSHSVSISFFQPVSVCVLYVLAFNETKTMMPFDCGFRLFLDLVAMNKLTQSSLNVAVSRFAAENKPYSVRWLQRQKMRNCIRYETTKAM